MTLKESKLSLLLNDESFIRWLEGTASEKEKKGWDEWLKMDSKHHDIARKARKILTIPFHQIEPQDVTEALQRLQKTIREIDK